MSKKIAILSAIMLVFGGISIPGGFFINNTINDTITDSVDDALLAIEEEFVPVAEDMILEIGPAMALQMIKELAVPTGIPLACASFLEQLLYNAYDMGEEESLYLLGEKLVSGGDIALNMFFDKVEADLGILGGGLTSFSGQLKAAGFPYANGDTSVVIKGISEWYGEDLNIGEYDIISIFGLGLVPNPNPNDWLAWGQASPRWPLPVDMEKNNPPGFMQHTVIGFGILDFLKYYEMANEDGSQEAKDEFCALYEVGEKDITFEQMGVVCDYFNEYWTPEVVPLIIAELQNESTLIAQTAPEYVYMSLEDIAYYEFLKQWINFSTYMNGIDFHEFADSLPPGMHGFEVDSPTISVDSLYALWDELDEWSFLNMTGIEKWLAANTNLEDKLELEQHFGLTSQESQDILDWLWNGPNSFSRGILPLLLESEAGYGMSLSELAKRLMLEQWANGTVMGMTLYEGGIDFSETIPSLPKGTIGFEVGVPNPTGMSMESALLLWDTSNPYSLVNDISVWWSITSKTSENYAVVRDANKLNDSTMDMILKWLPAFRNNLMPLLAQYQMGLPMDTTELGNVIQIGGTIFGGIAIALASTGFVSNRVVSKKKNVILKPDKSKTKNRDNNKYL